MLILVTELLIEIQSWMHLFMELFLNSAEEDMENCTRTCQNFQYVFFWAVNFCKTQKKRK